MQSRQPSQIPTRGEQTDLADGATRRHGAQVKALSGSDKPAPSRAREEDALREHLEAGRLGDAATGVMKVYGPEVLGFLVGALRDEADALEVFSQVSYDLWRGLPGFRADSSFRTWMYTLARNAMHRFHRDPRRKRRASLSEAGASQLEHVTREITRTFERTDVRGEIAALRDSLDADERTLLILRVDRGLSFRDIALVFAEGGVEDSTAGTLAKREATLRKRFERVKATLRAQAEAKGLVRKRAQ